MKNLRRPKSFVLLYSVIVIFAVSCSGPNRDVVIVDFKNTDTPEITAKSDTNDVLSVAIATMISPKITYSLYESLFLYISEKLGMRVSFIKISSYKEVNKMLIDKTIDVAFICSGPYVSISDYVDILAVPVVNGEPYYQAYVITSINSGITTFEELNGRSFAFADPQSNTGKNYPVLRAIEVAGDPDTFFGSTIYSYSHDISIELVAKGLVDGASVDALIYDFIARKDPGKVKNIRIIEVSEKYGIPPVVVPESLDNDKKEALRHILVNMHKDVIGAGILKQLSIEYFTLAEDSLYNSIRKSMVIF